MSIEEMLGQLENIASALEEEEVTLEKSFQLYQEGIKLIKKCNDTIGKTEKKLIMLEEEEQ